GQGGSLKEQVLGSQLYGKDADFDRAADPIVRVDARRLRDKLREYYAEFPQDPILILLPKGGYVPVFQQNGAAAVPVATKSPELAKHSTNSLSLSRMAAGVAALLASLLIGSVIYQRTKTSAGVVNITPFLGSKIAPALSPDGRFVAFSYNGPEGKRNPDI